jgi:two-component system, OmpR family, sensor histidine kinase VicK
LNGTPPSDTHAERTEVLYGVNNTTNEILNFLSSAKTKMDICADYTWPSVAMGVDVFKKALLNIKDRGIKARFVTDITKNNLEYCKEALKIGELRHLVGIKGNFALSEKEYMASATLQEATPLQQVIYSNVKEILEQQQYVFDTFWNKSIPAEQKIKELEGGLAPDAIEVIHNSSRAQDLYFDIVKSAREEILLIFPTPNAFIRQENMGVIRAVIEKSEKSNVKARILMPAHNLTENSVQTLRRRDQYRHGNIDIRYIEVTSGTKATILLADRKFSLVMELKDDSEMTFNEAIGLSTFSNSAAGVLSYVSIFESLWKQTELYEKVKESNKLLEEANEQLKVHDKMQKEFINIAAHELRTPIQPIISTVGIIRSRKASMKEYQLDDSLDMITRSAERLKQLSSDILDITKIESQLFKLNKEKFNLNDLLSKTVEDYKNQIAKTNVNIKLVFRSSENTILVEADKNRITQVISNLLRNAIKFTKKGDGTISIEVRKTEGEREEPMSGQRFVMISIKDTGRGIDPDILPRLFEKFASKSFQGTGLGLFISKTIVEAHGGKIWLEDNDKNLQREGATFSFTLPVISNQKYISQQQQQQQSSEVPDK